MHPIVAVDRRWIINKRGFAVNRFAAVVGVMFLAAGGSVAADQRTLVEMPSMMQEHMLSNMRDHLIALDEILRLLAADSGDKAAEVAERRLGMSSMDAHGADHMAPYMPPVMRETGTAMHKAASRFARKAEEGSVLGAYNALNEVTAACVACHTAFRIR